MIERGGTNQERLYLFDMNFQVHGKPISIKKTDMPDMRDIIHRHQSRYSLPIFFSRPGMKVLDFPCGSGYAYSLFNNVIYEGMDNDWVTIEYARRLYCNSEKVFLKNDLEKPSLSNNKYDIIACIEGLEHIDLKFQQPLIECFKKALKVGGRLIVSSPEAYDKSGPSKDNPYHKGELTKLGFTGLLESVFKNIHIITIEDKLHNGNKANLMFSVCQKEGDSNG